MLRHLSICATFIAFTVGSVNAQQREAVLQKMEVPGGGFDIILGMPKSPNGAILNLGNTPDALIVHLIGGELALSFDSVEKMLKALDSLHRPACAFQVEASDKQSGKPVAVYIVPRGE